MKTKVGTLRGNIVSILPSVVVDADIKKRKRPIKNKRKQNDLSNIDGNLTDCTGFLWCCK